MLVVMDKAATPEMIQRVRDEIDRMGLSAQTLTDPHRLAFGITGYNGDTSIERLRALDGVSEVIRFGEQFTLASRATKAEDTIVEVDGVSIGGDKFPVLAGPCSIESRDQAMTIAEIVAKEGVRIFRGGAFKPRTSPYSFQGLGEKGLEILREVREQFKLRIVTEAMDTETIELVAATADIIQIGSRNMQNYSLLRKAGALGKPVMLKRGMAATVNEFLLAAEYILAAGNPNVILCERGLRIVANRTGNMLDLSSIVDIRRASHLPILADPSHASEQRYKVAPLSRAAMAVGAHGLLIEVHHQPELALSDGPQALTPDDFRTLMVELRRMSVALNKELL
ncbi:MAG: 3-deoxy-7-phosphoheptulonate synthase [candidate division Zixibacteria bacterium]|jgi:3-deoxy-7-phosphoheptulonate synthase|nr:3-deoxy-7-phosphoheptulonate synthase [candidate division Zixibacteria bacterium]